MALYREHADELLAFFARRTFDPEAAWSASRSRYEAGRTTTAAALGAGVVYREFLYPRQRCIYPGRDPFCRNIAVGTG